MAKEDNLIPFTEMSPSRHSELSKKGQKASVEARKKKKSMKETLEMLLEMETKSGRTNREEITIGLINGAKKGNSNNYRTILETLGEITQEQYVAPVIEVAVVDNSNLEKVMYETNRHNKDDDRQ